MLIGGEGKNRFYVVRSKVLQDKSLLQYIVDNGARMMKQREDLLDVLAKHVETVDSQGKSLDQKQIELKIINNLKLGLPSSIGLAECIKMTEEKFPWSDMKARGMIALSIIVNLLCLGLYFVDISTDGQFVDEMFNNSLKNLPEFKVLQENCTVEFYNEMKDEKWKTLCERETKYCYELHENLTHLGQKCRDFGIRSVWGC